MVESVIFSPNGCIPYPGNQSELEKCFFFNIFSMVSTFSHICWFFVVAEIEIGTEL